MSSSVNQTFTEIYHTLFDRPGAIMATELIGPEFAEMPRCWNRFDHGVICELPAGHKLLGGWNGVACNTRFGVQAAEKYYREHPELVGKLTPEWQELRDQWQDLMTLYHWLIEHHFTRHGEYDYSCGVCGCVVSNVFVHADWHDAPPGSEANHANV